MLPFRTDLATRARYSQGGGIHRIIPAAVARPTTITELDEAIGWGKKHGWSITPRGAGSAMSGSAVGEGLILDLTALHSAAAPVAILSHPDRAVTDAGATLGDIAEAAARSGLRLGPDPSSAAWATVAGAISTNAAGSRSYRLGAMDRWVTAVQLHTSEGPLRLARDTPEDPMHPVIQRFHRDALPVLTAHRAAVEARLPRTRKNSAGYGLARYWQSGDLLDLVIGSEGTLGVITSAELRLEPVPPHRAALRIVLADRKDLPAAVLALAAADPTSIEFLDRSLLQLAAPQLHGADTAILTQAAAVLLVEVEAEHEAALARRLETATMAVRWLALDVQEASGPDGIAGMWTLRHVASPILAAIEGDRRSLQVIEDGCVPPAALGEYLDAVEEACEAAGINAVMFGHAGDGHVHVNLLPDPTEGDWLDRVATVYHRVNASLLHLGGTPAGEHGAGRLRAGLLELFLGPEAVACFGAIKEAFDPAGLFNRGVIIPDGQDPFDRLKVGANAAPLPSGLEQQLRRIEAERGWGESRWESR